MDKIEKSFIVDESRVFMAEYKQFIIITSLFCILSLSSHINHSQMSFTTRMF